MAMAWEQILPTKVMGIIVNGQVRPGCEFVPLDDENSSPTMKDFRIATMGHRWVSSLRSGWRSL